MKRLKRWALRLGTVLGGAWSLYALTLEPVGFDRLLALVLWTFCTLFVGLMLGAVAEKRYGEKPLDQARQERLDAAHEKFRQTIIDLVESELRTRP